ncbi:TD and POZ domain-containing protein 5 [Trichonephila inaurata madagascariensis]|uniref:TD and POZ domain-containing protein 5 n=1 Tax=Trichonephila inaurata madagascariensis TaxID=2747483 RepID=A0A8X7BXL5_9ARAC|nr:TD and POZ domain-containing protein 5 [Trichonephila inaurata madagascariensis]
MATPNYGIKSTCTFLWKIKNFNFLWLKTSQKIESPVFVVDGLENTEWVMHLYPRGCSSADKIGFYLHRKDGGSSTDEIDVYFELAFLSESGTVLCSCRSVKLTFSKCSSWGFDSFKSRENVFVAYKSGYLPFNTLTAQCKIWNCDKKVDVHKYFLAGTCVAVQQISFHWQIEKFITIGYNDTKHSVIRSIANEILVKFDLYLTGEQLGEEVIEIGIHVFDPNKKYLFFKTFVSNYYGEFDNCGMKEFVWNGGEKKGTLTLLFSKERLQHESYLKDDVLTLYCECIFSTGIVSETIQTIDFGIDSLNTAPPAVLNVGRLPTDGVESVGGLPTDGVENVGGLPTDDAISLKEDLGSLCSRDVLSDMKFRTNTNMIPIHTQILGARSSVFRAMFTNDMKEKIEGSVDITDLDDDTVRRMLLYMYTDKLEDLQWESAFQLYMASNKYDIASLRSRCRAILQAKMSPNNACQILILANLHLDEALKKTVQKYILMQGKTIFSSSEWKLLMKTDLQLAAEIMYQNCNKD